MKGHIRKGGKNSFEIVIYLGEDEIGKPKYTFRTVRGGRRKAEDECTRLLNQVGTGEYVEPSRTTIEQYLERWLADYATTNVGGKTFERYAEIIRAHLIPALGQHRLTKLQPLQIQTYYSTALQSGRRDGKGGLSAQTVVHRHRVLKDALQQAVRWRLLVRNPAEAVEPPRPAEREMQVLDEEQTATLLKAVEKTSLHIPVLLAATTGMRRGEILTVRWTDLDLKAGTLVRVPVAGADEGGRVEVQAAEEAAEPPRGRLTCVRRRRPASAPSEAGCPAFAGGCRV